MSTKKLVRQNFRNAVLSRDKHKCVVCGESAPPVGAPPASEQWYLDPHHITDRNELPNGGYVLENGITLCPFCHQKAEKYHSSGHTEFEPGFHPDDLYKLIRSSYAKALAASKRLI